MPSGTHDWKGCGTLQLIFIPLYLFHHIGSHDIHVGKPQQRYKHAVQSLFTLNPMIPWKWQKTFIYINFLPPPASNQHPCRSSYKYTDLYIKSINVVRHSLLSVNTSARLLKDACPSSLTLGFFYIATISACAFSCSCEWFPHLSIATTPNNSLPASWVKKCNHFFAITPNPQTGSQARVLAFSLLRVSVSTLDLDQSSSWPINY